MDQWMDGSMDGSMDQWMDQWINGWINGEMHGSMNEWTFVHSFIDPWIVMDGWRNRQDKRTDTQ